jgi:hypothetical protein
MHVWKLSFRNQINQEVGPLEESQNLNDKMTTLISVIGFSNTIKNYLKIYVDFSISSAFSGRM